jgi:hypothetical protein
VAGERVADPLRPAVSAREQGESLEGEGGAGAIAQEVFEALEVVRDVAISERDTHARIDGKPQGRDGLGAVGEEAAEAFRDGDDPLPHGYGRDDAVDEVRGGLRHAAAIA